MSEIVHYFTSKPLAMHNSRITLLYEKAGSLLWKTLLWVDSKFTADWL